MANKKPIAVFDIDGTIFRSSLLVEITNAMIRIGAFPPETHNLYRKEYTAWLNRTGSYDDYLDKIILVFEKQLPGIRQEVVEAISEIVIQNLSLQTYRYTRDLINRLKKTHFLVAISGSPHELVSRFAKRYGFSDLKATEYKIKEGIYAGQLSLGYLNKDKTLQSMVRKHGLTLKGSVGVGDTESDAAFLKLVERPIAFNPNKKLFDEARAQSWRVVVERKNMIYRLEARDGHYELAQAN